VTGDAVFIADGVHARRRVVETGIRGSRAVEITKGLSAGEWVVAPATTDIREGMRVRPEPAVSSSR
jgi:multidrug efflux pump subunit AcrA (membrane-fusion protein)